VHDVVALEHGSEDRKNSYEDNGSVKAQQPAAYSGADTVGGIVGADIPADIGAGPQQ